MGANSVITGNNGYIQRRSNSPQFNQFCGQENERVSPELMHYGYYYCGFRYSYKYYLVKHMQTHNREKPYKCSGCKKQYNRKEYLNQHALVNSGNKPFGCSDCGTPFMYGASYTEIQG